MNHSQRIRAGLKFEQTVSDMINAMLGSSTWRNHQFSHRFIGQSDVYGLPGWSIEVKHSTLDQARPTDKRKWWSQVCYQAKGINKPVVIYKSGRDDVRCIFMPFSGADVRDYSNVIDTSLKIWGRYVLTGRMGDEQDIGTSTIEVSDDD